MKPRLNSLAWISSITSGGNLAHSQTGVASGQVSECPWVAKSEPGLEPNLTSLDRPENSCAATLPIQPAGAWEDLQRRMGETPQILVCQVSSVIPKKTWRCNRCQRCFNKVLSKGSEYLCKCNILVFLTLFLLCRYGLLCVDYWRKKKQFNTCYSLILKLIKSFFPSSIYTQYLIMTKQKQVFRNVADL